MDRNFAKVPKPNRELESVLTGWLKFRAWMISTLNIKASLKIRCMFCMQHGLCRKSQIVWAAIDRAEEK
jgi:hypothetical protein